MRLITQDAPELIVESIWKAGRGLGTPEKQSSILLHQVNSRVSMSKF